MATAAAEVRERSPSGADTAGDAAAHLAIAMGTVRTCLYHHLVQGQCQGHVLVHVGTACGALALTG